MSGYGTVVVRFNGGAQASHTVQRGTLRHAFSHFGSGTFAGAETFLGSQFIINPTVLRIESGELLKLNKLPISIYSDPFCRVTTIYDMLYNQWLEKQRGDNRHGSCGLGINATVDRHEKASLYLHSPFSMLDDVRQYYIEKINTTDINKEFFDGEEEKFTDSWLHEYQYARRFIDMSSSPLINAEHVIFEGAQGLMLDEFNGVFPHVTRSRTGLTNLYEDPAFIQLINECDDTEVLYITRAYATRHGRGPFWDNADVVHQYFDVDDPTNIPNPWQETLRLGPINFDQLNAFISRDVADQLKSAIAINNYSLVVTCMDQINGTHVPVYDDGRDDKYIVVDRGEFSYQLRHFTFNTLSFDRLITASGHRNFDIGTREEL